MKRILNAFVIAGLMLASVTVSAQEKEVMSYGHHDVTKVVTGYRPWTQARIIKSLDDARDAYGYFIYEKDVLKVYMGEYKGTYVRKINDMGYPTFVKKWDLRGRTLMIHVERNTIGFWDSMRGKYTIYLIKE